MQMHRGRKLDPLSLLALKASWAHLAHYSDKDTDRDSLDSSPIQENAMIAGGA